MTRVQRSGGASEQGRANESLGSPPLPLPFFQPHNPILQARDELSLLDNNGHDDALERNGSHRVKIFRKMQLCGTEDVVKQLLVLLSKPATVFGPACQFVVDDVGKGRYGSSHRSFLLVQEIPPGDGSR